MNLSRPRARALIDLRRQHRHSLAARGARTVLRVSEPGVCAIGIVRCVLVQDGLPQGLPQNSRAEAGVSSQFVNPPSHGFVNCRAGRHGRSAGR